MELFVKTRSETKDYEWLITAPDDHWWDEYASVVVFEEPTLIAVTDGRRWRAWVSGLPSTRKDRTGATIRFTVAGTGVCGDSGEAALMEAAVRNWVAAVTDDCLPGELAIALDREFPEDYVRDRIVKRDRAAAADVQRRLQAALETLAKQTPKPEALGLPVSRAPEAKQRFMAAVHAVFAGSLGLSGVAALLSDAVNWGEGSGRQNVALLASLATREDQLRPVAGGGRRLVALYRRGGDDWEVAELDGGLTRNETIAIGLVGAAVLLGVAAVAWWLWPGAKPPVPTRS